MRQLTWAVESLFKCVVDRPNPARAGMTKMSKRKEVVTGQAFRRLGGGGGLWRVLSIRKDGLGTPHATLQRADDHNTLKTLSVSTLLDNSQFVPEE